MLELFLKLLNPNSDLGIRPPGSQCRGQGPKLKALEHIPEGNGKKLDLLPVN